MQLKIASGNEKKEKVYRGDVYSVWKIEFIMLKWRRPIKWKCVGFFFVVVENLDSRSPIVFMALGALKS